MSQRTSPASAAARSSKPRPCKRKNAPAAPASMDGRAILDASVEELAFQATVFEYAELRGWKVFHDYHSRWNVPGWPDGFLIRPPRIVVAEFKTMTGELSLEQRIWLVAFAACPHIETFIWRPNDWRQIERVLA